MQSLAPIQVRHYGVKGRERLVLHGGPGAPGSVSGLAKLLASDFRVLEPLQRRSGQERLTVARHVQDLADVAPASCAIVGHSWGAMLALSYAARHPERVTRLLLIGCGTYDEACREALRKTLQLRLGESGLSQVTELERALKSTTDVAQRDVLMRKLGGAFSLLESFELLEETESERDELPADAVGHAETWQDVLNLQAQHIEPELFATITVPVILVQGDTDPHPGPMTRDLLKRYMPQLEYMGLDRCGHEPWRERYAREPFLDTLRIWLNR